MQADERPGRQKHLLSLIVAHNAHMRQHLPLQDLSSILDTLLPCDTHSCTSLANVVQSYLNSSTQLDASMLDCSDYTVTS